MIYAQPITVTGAGGIVTNYANSGTATNSITAHNGECCTEHFYAPFDYPAEYCLYCGETRDVRVSGDLDSDRYVTNTDLTLLVRYLAGFGTPAAYCDLDRNGKTNNRDAIELIRMIENK